MVFSFDYFIQLGPFTLSDVSDYLRLFNQGLKDLVNVYQRDYVLAQVGSLMENASRASSYVRSLLMRNLHLNLWSYL